MTKSVKKNSLLPQRSGNRCGHNPQMPRLYLSLPPKTGPGGIPPLLNAAIVKVRHFFYMPNVLPSLNWARNSSRQQRSERREACVLVLQALLQYTDLTSLRVAIPTEGGYLNLSEDFLANRAGLKLKRTQRALADLKKSGILALYQTRQRAADGWRSSAAVKQISILLFESLGLGECLKAERSKAEKRKEAQTQKKSNLGKAKLGLVLKSLLNPLKRGGHSSQSLSSYETSKNLEQARRLQIKAYEFFKKNPSWDRKRCYAEAKKYAKTTTP